MTAEAMKMIRNRSRLLLDMDGTLLDLAYDNQFWAEQFPAAIATARGWDLIEAKGIISSILAEAEGTLAWYCIDHWSDIFAVDVRALKREDPSRIRFADNAREFLQRAREAGYHLPLVTNAHPDLIKLKHEKTGILDCVDDIYCSHDAGVPKEDPAFWTWLSEKSGRGFDDAIMFDDSPRVLKIASGFVDVIAIAKPDSGQAPRDMAPFPAVDLIGELSL